MAWVTGPHSDAPEGAICYVTGDEPGMVTWFEPEEVEPPPPPPPPQREGENV